MGVLFLAPSKVSSEFLRISVLYFDFSSGIMKAFPCTLGIFILHATDGVLSKNHINFKSARVQLEGFFFFS